MVRPDRQGLTGASQREPIGIAGSGGTTTAAVVQLAGIAGLVSFGHMYELALRVGEDQWARA